MSNSKRNDISTEYSRKGVVDSPIPRPNEGKTPQIADKGKKGGK